MHATSSSPITSSTARAKPSTEQNTGNIPSASNQSFTARSAVPPRLTVMSFADCLSPSCLQIAPYATIFCNGGLWNPSSPRLLTTAQLAELQSNPKNLLTSIVDISCDFHVRRSA